MPGAVLAPAPPRLCFVPMWPCRPGEVWCFDWQHPLRYTLSLVGVSGTGQKRSELQGQMQVQILVLPLRSSMTFCLFELCCFFVFLFFLPGIVYLSELRRLNEIMDVEMSGLWLAINAE